MASDPIDAALEAYLDGPPHADFRVPLRAAIAAYLRVEAKSYPRMLPATSFRHPGFLLHELANKAAGLKDDEDDADGE